MKNNFPLIALVLFLFTLLYGYPLLLGGQTLAGDDIVTLGIPILTAFKEQLARGEFPFWNPWFFAGRPLLGDVLGFFTYPPYLLLMPLPSNLTLDLILLVHLWFGAFGMAVWMRPRLQHALSACLAGVLLMFSGYALARLHLGHFFITTIAWLPWMLWAWDRLRNSIENESDQRGSDFALFTSAIALSILSVNPQIAYYSLIILALYALLLARSWCEGLWFAGGCALALGLCAVQLLPTSVTANASWDRSSEGAAWSYITDGSVEPRMLLTQLVPFFFGNPTRPGYWGQMGYGEVTAYLSMGGLFLTLLYLLGRRTIFKQRWLCGIGDDERRDTIRFEIFLVAMLVLSALFILGKRSPVFWLGYHIIPGFDRFRQPGRMFIFYTFGSAALSAWTLDRLLIQRTQLRARGASIVALLLLLGVLAGAGLWNSAEYWMQTPDTAHIFAGAIKKIPEALATLTQMRSEIILHTGIFVAIWSVTGMLLLGIFFAKTPKQVLCIGSLFFLLCAGDLLHANWPLQSTQPRATVVQKQYPETERVRFLQNALKDGGRYLCMDTALDYRTDGFQPELLTNRPIMHKLTTLRGYSPVNSKRFGLVMNQISGLPLDFNPGGQMRFVDEKVDWKLLALWDCRVVLSYQKLTAPELKEIASWNMDAAGENTLHAYQLKAATPARLCQPVLVPSDSTLDEQVLCLDSPKFDCLTQALVMEAPFEDTPGITKVDASASVHAVPSGKSGTRVFETESATPTLLVTAESYYPGWKATVDGKSEHVLPANVAQCAVPVPAGKHRVEMRYRPNGVYQGAAISAVSLLLLVLLVRRFRRDEW
ncbi:TPA: hypothetical protein DDW35_03915 [Candidatus Sumerlaeota bacterium]|nr:hypothetical protein [Candidatus Sumerlaeota bacterium]